MRWLLLLVLWGLVSPAQAATLYATHPGYGTVLPPGSPCSLATALCLVAAGDTILMKNGTYTGVNSMLTPPTGKAGTASQRITVQAETDGGVLIDGTNQYPAYWAWLGWTTGPSRASMPVVRMIRRLSWARGQTRRGLERVIAWDQRRDSRW